VARTAELVSSHAPVSPPRGRHFGGARPHRGGLSGPVALPLPRPVKDCAERKGGASQRPPHSQRSKQSDVARPRAPISDDLALPAPACGQAARTPPPLRVRSRRDRAPVGAAHPA
jgi:hypothetical protein